ncbi:uncharacterized protein SPPG_02645 [Spizellomyces punctatus DAOM BR117]|uniref:Phosphoglycerate mutase n=1 Tax=Spizellomyces punctatus (strain DAOM BR117) TaxID=645134 RepID=A0A0L0HM71_SPIPD|nr:uncharacterized protein SPPG_02645 [Spizellomyces punctatus DAOM BR117]KND02153.1 hypothetical protein SPPG_02645 [Spizellomyces punctatus DAOM BR117]|eukprot:XP_016610192.1 hypothetical protein SPPG_02645 [Spizellomyces punctatus DAOM BR117]
MPLSPQMPIHLQSTPLRYTILDGFFVQSRPDTNDSSFPLVPPHLGLIDTEQGRWERFVEKLERVQEEIGDKGVVKVLLLQRHGQGIHNAAEEKYGKIAWDDYYSRLPEYFDAPLTPLGISQLHGNTDLIKGELGDGLPLPSLILSSPLSRCLNTTRLIWGSLVEGYHPRVLEDLRESYGEHTCDKRRSRTELEGLWPEFDFSGLVSDEDTLWKPDEREEDQHVDERVQRVFDGIFMDREHLFVGIVCHGGIIEASLRVTGHRAFSVRPGGLIPIVVVGWREATRCRV